MPREDLPPPAAAEFKYKGKKERKRKVISAAGRFRLHSRKSVAALALITRNETERSRVLRNPRAGNPRDRRHDKEEGEEEEEKK